MHVARSIAAFCVLALATRLTFADGLPEDLAGILRGLGSDQPATREAAQRELAQVPAARLGDLRVALAETQNEAVAGRVYVRIRELELYAELHPPGLTVDLKDADWPQVIKALNAQLGGNYLSASGVGGHVTLAARDQPLWEILRQINEQAPFAVEAPTESYASRKTNWFALHPLGVGAKGSPIAVTDGVGMRTKVHGNPAVGSWMVECVLYEDPRIMVISHGVSLQVESAVDEAGRKLVPLDTQSTSDLIRSAAVPPFSSTAAFEKAPDVKVIKQLRGKVTVDILVPAHTMSVDLARQLASPFATLLGVATLESGENDSYALKLHQDRPVATRRPQGVGGNWFLTLRGNDAKKQVMQEIVAVGDDALVRFRGHDGTRRATSVDLVFPNATISRTRPIELKDLPVVTGRDGIP